MAKKRLFWQLYPSYLIVILIAVLAISAVFSSSLRQFSLDQTASDLESRARIIEDQIAKLPFSQIDPFCKDLGKKSGTRITFVLPSGLVKGDSIESPERMDNHGDRPEVIKALNGKTGRSLRFSHTLNQDMMYIAIPLVRNHEIFGVVRTSISVSTIHQKLIELFWKISFGVFLIALIAAGISYLFTRRITQPIETIKQGAKRFAKGDLTQKLPIPHSEEIGSLAQVMNEMALQLDERIRNEIAQGNEKDAILSSMVEGVLALDEHEQIISLNEAASKLLGLEGQNVQGKKVPEIIRNSDLQAFIKETFSHQEPIEGEIIMGGPEERFLNAHGTILHDAQDRKMGALIVLNDVTRIRRLDSIRRDFVANVSHELKTPITSIKGFVETLLDGAYKDAKDAQRFLEIIAKHTDRLNAIIDDLLSLSRIEADERQEKIALQEESLKDVLQAAVQVCESNSKAKNIHLVMDCPEDLKATINSPLLEQALVNLIDNSIKYSQPKSEVQVSATKNGQKISIQVQDRGCGISDEDLPRLFERFYRADKSRSRELGGTGLGLAIAKHIVQNHRGTITVMSELGKGSTFTIKLPLL